MSEGRGLHRREVLVGLLATAATACRSSAKDGGGDTQIADTEPVTDSDPATDSDPVTDSEPPPTVPWATGGTQSLAADYEVDFGEGCAQTCELTLGPCYTETLERQDISEQVDGLPTYMAFRVLNLACEPVAGAVVDVWHCSPSGLYSGPDAVNLCTRRDEAARAGRWFRGTLTTDADGRASFHTCMPGWYAGRAVHIHLQVRVGGQAFLTSQLGFDEALLRDVFTSHPAYRGYGPPDTSNRRDGILGTAAERLFAWRKASDGALVVWKTLVVRGSLGEEAC